MLSRIVVILALPLLAGQTEAWRKFAPKDAGFAVSLPAAPKEQKQQLKVGDTAADVMLYLCGAPGDVTYVVSVTQFPKDQVEGGQEQRLRNARDGAVQKSKGKLFHERKIKLGAHPGRELWIQTPDEGMIHTRLYAVHQRLYQTMAIGPKKMVETKETEVFLNSFQLRE